MYSPEIPEEEALHLTERAAWQRILKVSMLHALRWMEALYLSKQAWAERGNAPLNDERYAEWIEWMKAMDENPALLLQTHPHLDEYLLEERIRCFMGGHEALAKLATGAALSEYDKKRARLPPIVEHLSFVQHLRLHELQIGGKTSQQLEDLLQERGITPEQDALFMMRQPEFITLSEPKSLLLAHVSVGDLFQDKEDHPLPEVYARAKELGLGPCPAEVGPYLRLALTDQPLMEWFDVATEPLPASQLCTGIFCLGRTADKVWLGTEQGLAMNQDSGSEFVFEVLF